ncbi:MAG TPA: PEP-CTERM sorting domain-containing protein [Deltaproteobacteria bacterium]|nr:PEP-CTERM sorting domain-containing protein [Deltaproteobacteria bacterium]
MLPFKIGLKKSTPFMSGWGVALLLLLIALPGLAGAATISTTATVFHGAPLSLVMTIDDDSALADPGDLVITLELEVGSNIGDIRGFYAHVSDESLLSGLSITGPDITSSDFAANDVGDFGPGFNFNVAGSPCPCDLGAEIGTASIAPGDDIRITTFILSHASEDLTLGLFAGQSFGVWVDSVSRLGKERQVGHVTKLSGIVPVPEPTTALLMALGLAGLTIGGRRR